MRRHLSVFKSRCVLYARTRHGRQIGVCASRIEARTHRHELHAREFNIVNATRLFRCCQRVTRSLCVVNGSNWA